MDEGPKNRIRSDSTSVSKTDSFVTTFPLLLCHRIKKTTKTHSKKSFKRINIDKKIPGPENHKKIRKYKEYNRVLKVMK